jgi:hypothetical protein
MTALLLLSIAVAAALGVVAWRAHRRARHLRDWIDYAAPYMIRSGAPFQQIEPVLFPFEWTVVARGGDTRPGRTGGVGNCPCQSEYTVATDQSIINAWPNQAAVVACANNPPAADLPFWSCSDDCVRVWTHVWRGWMVVRHRGTGQLRFNCHTFAQYHCKKPDDPALDKPPVEGHPDDIVL